ncbi:ATP-binding protein [Micromonospora sp. C31]|uniref:ATP-binding protein n=1 Tax=Micromonospora sp. C31 TaxID=2824876 RepID=UPI001FFDE908|nr:ATP-binding protein [Micromonospora sp. C31]
MATDARCQVEADEASGVLRVTGVLDHSGATTVRDGLLTRLCGRPGAVVADLTDLRVADPAARDVFAEVRREVRHWPAADLLLCDPSGAVEGVPAWPTLDGAMAGLAAAPLAAVVEADLTPVVGAARQARQLVARGCGAWALPELIEPACIAVTEMVNNVVAHAHTPMTVRLAPRDDTLHLSVRDHSSRQPAFTGTAPPDTAGGRGLLLIDTVARSWGSSRVPDGKVVWCVLHVADEAGNHG